MNKLQTALTIGKLFGTAIGLTIVLIGTILIEGLELAVKFGTWVINELNKPEVAVTILPPGVAHLKDETNSDLLLVKSFPDIIGQIHTFIGQRPILPPNTEISTLRSAEITTEKVGLPVQIKYEMSVNQYSQFIKEWSVSELSLKGSSAIKLMLPAKIKYEMPIVEFRQFQMGLNQFTAFRRLIKELPWEVLNVIHLKKLAQYRSIKGYSKMNKSRLMQALTAS